MSRSAELAGLLTLIQSGNPTLNEIREYYTSPASLLLLSQAANGLGSQWDRRLSESRHEGLDSTHHASQRVKQLLSKLAEEDSGF